MRESLRNPQFPLLATCWIIFMGACYGIITLLSPDSKLTLTPTSTPLSSPTQDLSLYTPTPYSTAEERRTFISGWSCEKVASGETSDETAKRLLDQGFSSGTPRSYFVLHEVQTEEGSQLFLKVEKKLPFVPPGGVICDSTIDTIKVLDPQ